jgi:hypothetical protein
MLSRRTIAGGILQSWAYQTAMKAHISQLIIAETTQEGQTRLVFSPCDEGRYPSIDETEKPSADGARSFPKVG